MSPLRIVEITAWEALDSRGRPTVGCAVTLSGGVSSQATVPSGASRGTHEAHELRDGGDRYSGLGVTRAVSHVRGEIASALVGMTVDSGFATESLSAVDDTLRALDGTPQLGRLGANAILAVSVATALALAAASGRPLYDSVADGSIPLLPIPMVNIISGGAHAGHALDVQDFLAVPVGATMWGS